MLTINIEIFIHNGVLNQHITSIVNHLGFLKSSFRNLLPYHNKYMDSYLLFNIYFITNLIVYLIAYCNLIWIKNVLLFNNLIFLVTQIFVMIWSIIIYDMKKPEKYKNKISEIINEVPLNGYILNTTTIMILILISLVFNIKINVSDFSCKDILILPLGITLFEILGRLEHHFNSKTFIHKKHHKEALMLITAGNAHYLEILTVLMCVIGSTWMYYSKFGLSFHMLIIYVFGTSVHEMKFNEKYFFLQKSEDHIKHHKKNDEYWNYMIKYDWKFII